MDDGEQINFIGYSGGATVVFNAAAMLEAWGERWGQSPPRITNLVTIGGVVWRNSWNRPSTVASWTRITGANDAIAAAIGFADQDVLLPGIGHLQYWDEGSNLSRVVDAIWSAGVR